MIRGLEAQHEQRPSAPSRAGHRRLAGIEQPAVGGVQPRLRERADRLRAALEAEAKAKGEAAASMKCPRCDGSLNEEVYDDVHIDRCGTCHGVWLDAGELEQIAQEESTPSRWRKVFWPGGTSETNR